MLSWRPSSPFHRWWSAWRSRSASASTGACAITSAVRTAATSCGVSRRAGFGAARADGSIRKVFACDDRALAAHAPRPHRRRPRGPPPGRRGVVRVRQGTESGHGGVRRGHGSPRRRPGTRDFYYEALLADLGRAQELAGQKADAIETYRRILKELPQARRAEEIRARLRSLGG